RVAISSDIADLNGIDVLRSLCRGKRVLLVGGSGEPAATLHLALEPVCTRLDGVAVAPDVPPAPLARGQMFARLEDVTGSYDVVLVPEMLARVPNAGTFLAQVQAIDASTFLLSVPDAYQCAAQHFEHLDAAQTFVETVHPDTNAWYTPYT
ncbi:hypothetical protein, partial [Heyndrickxia ginsengihumi]|uniref:hypothetical protein n=1 Tax=Heyndrickxia ginsengihumi TaxID=363870 RepID=UPI00203A81ED